MSPHHQPIRRKSHAPTLCLEEPLPEPSGSTGFLSHLFFLLWRRKWQPTPVFFLGESQGWRSLVGCRLWGRTESDTTERLHFHFSLSYTGEGNGNPFQGSCLENPRDGGAWWAAFYGVAQSQTQLTRLSSSSSRKEKITPG